MRCNMGKRLQLLAARAANHCKLALLTDLRLHPGTAQQFQGTLPSWKPRLEKACGCAAAFQTNVGHSVRQKHSEAWTASAMPITWCITRTLSVHPLQRFFSAFLEAYKCYGRLAFARVYSASCSLHSVRVLLIKSLLAHSCEKSSKARCKHLPAGSRACRAPSICFACFVCSARTLSCQK